MNTLKYAPLALAAALNGCAAKPTPEPQTPLVITVGSPKDTDRLLEEPTLENEPFVSDRVQALLNQVPLVVTDRDEYNTWHSIQDHFGKTSLEGFDGIKVYTMCRASDPVVECRKTLEETYRDVFKRNSNGVQFCTEQAKADGLGDSLWHQCIMEKIDTDGILKRISYACEQRVLQCMKPHF